MPYTPTTWADGSGGATKINATRLNHLESGIQALRATAEAASATASTASARATTAQGTATAAQAAAAAAQATANAALPKSTATAKGDLLVATGSATWVRLPVGGNDRQLMADSTQTEGLKYGPKIQVGDSLPSVSGLVDDDLAFIRKSGTAEVAPNIYYWDDTAGAWQEIAIYERHSSAWSELEPKVRYISSGAWAT